VPEVALPISLNEYIQNNKISGFVLHHRGDKTLLDYEVEKEINVLIGPEGGLSETEIQEAIQHNHQALLLGKTVLRTETASLCALSQLALLWC
jgi:16S rRNA (uracil1498-N3)-methyltransferase